MTTCGRCSGRHVKNSAECHGSSHAFFFRTGKVGCKNLILSGVTGGLLEDRLPSACGMSVHPFGQDPINAEMAELLRCGCNV